MKYDIVLCGVGGQGGISVSVVIAQAALAAGLKVKQSEVHGMAQRGGEVLAELRISDADIASPSIPLGCADLILSFEPLEAFRYLSILGPQAHIISASTPVINISNYPPIESVLAALKKLPNSIAIDADALAREAGNPRAANMVLIGAAAKLLPFPAAKLEDAIRKQFARKGDAVVEANIKAFEYGQKAHN